MVVSDNNESRIISGIAYRGVNIQEVEKYPGCVVDRIRTMSKFKWVITPESHNAKFELRNYVWNDKKAEIPVDKHNHIIKAAEYAATRLLQGSDFLAGNY
jgi:phage terminase large subunit